MTEPKDIFAKFRQAGEAQDEQKPGSTAGGQEPEADYEDEPYLLPPLRPESYTAFRLGKRRERLLIDRATQPMRFPLYFELKDISFDQALQTGFNLFFHAMTVEVMGKNLWPVVHAISNGRCSGIYEYHAKVYPSLPRKDEPLIESIKILPPAPLADDSD